MPKNSRPRLFVDMDKCTVLTLYISPGQQHHRRYQGFTHITTIPPFTSENAGPFGLPPRVGDIIASAARPSARPFLLELATWGDVEILTNGPSSDQVPILQALGLFELVKHVWCRDTVDQLPVPERCRWVLIDDHPVDKRVKTKMRWLGVNEKPASAWRRYINECFVQCVEWSISTYPHDPAPLTDLLPVIAAKLERQRRRK